MKLKDRSGQAVVEYFLLLAITVGSMLFFVRKMSSSVDKAIPGLGKQMEYQLRGGAAPANLWRR